MEVRNTRRDGICSHLNGDSANYARVVDSADAGVGVLEGGIPDKIGCIGGS